MHCTKCGAALDQSNLNFCPACGYPVPRPTSAPNAWGAPPAPPPPTAFAADPGPTGAAGTGEYAGLVWNGHDWVGTTTVQRHQNGMGIASLVIGIIAVLLCGGGFLLPILAIVFGRTGMKRAKVGLADNGGVAKAGFILGIVAAGIGLAVGALYLASLATGGFDSPRTLNTPDVESAISQGLTEQIGGAYSVNCPESIVARVGGTFTCAVTDLGTGQTAVITGRQTNDQGKFDWEVTSTSDG